MDFYLYTVELPFSKINLNYRELSSKEQLILSKANTIHSIGDDECFLEYSLIFRNIISNCVKNKEDFLNLNLIDYLLFITKLRIVSIGNELKIQFKEEEDKKISVSLDLNIFMRNLYNAASEAFTEKVLTYDEFKINLDWPNITSEQYLINNSDNIKHTVKEYIKSIEIGDNIIEYKKFNQLEKEKIFQALPISLTSKIEKNVSDALNHLFEQNLFQIEKMSYYKCNFYDKKTQELLRLFFEEDLKNIYKEYYILASRNINPHYIDSLSIAERSVFCSLVEEERKTIEEGIGSSNSSGTSLESLINEFGG